MRNMRCPYHTATAHQWRDISSAYQVVFAVHVFCKQTHITNSQSGDESDQDKMFYFLKDTKVFTNVCELFTLSLYTVLTRLECVRRWRSGVEEEWMVE